MLRRALLSDARRGGVRPPLLYYTYVYLKQGSGVLRRLLKET